MQVHWAYFGCSKEDEEQLQRPWEAEQRRLRSRLDGLEDEPLELDLACHRQDAAPQWQIQSALHLPARTVVVRAMRKEPGEALGDVVTGLIDEIDRSAERPERITLRREGLDGLLPFLEQSREEGRSDVFLSWLSPVVASLAGHVRRELRLREMESDLGAGQLIPADVLNEVLLRAYDQFKRRPQNIPLDLWLLQLADDLVGESSHTPAEASLDEQVDKESVEPRESARDGWIEWPTYSETIQWGDVLRSAPGADAWDALDLETKEVELDRMLAQLPRQQRQALILHTIYGYSPGEVADFQRRSEDEVLADVDAGRYRLERFFHDEYLPTLEERLDPAERRASRRGIQ